MRARLPVALLLLVAVLTACSAALPGWSTPPLGRIAYGTTDGAIATMLASGGLPTILSPAQPDTTTGNSTQRRYAWPIWSPDGRRVAFLALGTDGFSGAVFVAEADGAYPVTLHELRGGYPIFLSWSPDGTTVAVLMSGSDRLHLLLADASGQGQPRELITGQPLYSSWAPDGHALLVHTGDSLFSQTLGHIYLVETDPGASPERIDIDANNFRAPAWSPAGRYQIIAGDNGMGSDALFLRDRDGGLRRLTDTGNAPAAVWSPAGDRLAWSDASDLSYYYDGLEIITPDGRARQRVTDEPLFAFFWSPDGTHIAYLTLDDSRTFLHWRVVSTTDGAPARTVASFHPTREYIQLLIYFDQYAQSMTIWSPDSRSLVYAGWPPGDEREDPPSLYTVAIDGDTPPHLLTPGRIGFFAPPRATASPRPTPARR